MASTAANNASLHKQVISCSEILVKKAQFGKGATASGLRSVAFGTDAVASAADSIMIGNGTNSTANYLQIANGAGTTLLQLGPDVNVTQLTNNDTAVTCSGVKGKITMKDPITAGAGHDIVVTNTFVSATSKIFLSMVGTTATGVATRDALTLHITSQGSGTFTIHVYNGDAANTTAAPVISYFILA